MQSRPAREPALGTGMLLAAMPTPTPTPIRASSREPGPLHTAQAPSTEMPV
jgi:hypothetical protein